MHGRLIAFVVTPTMMKTLTATQRALADAVFARDDGREISGAKVNRFRAHVEISADLDRGLVWTVTLHTSKNGRRTDVEDYDAYLARRARAEQRIREAEQHADDVDFEEADDDN